MSLCKGAAILCAFVSAHALRGRQQQRPQRFEVPDYSSLDAVIRNYHNTTYPRPARTDNDLKKCLNTKTVSVAGMSRSGSNSLMVIAGIWMTMTDPNFAGPHWFQDFERHYYEQLKGAHVSQLIQQDQPVGWVTSIADVMLTTHRNPVDMLMSVKLTYGDGDCDQTMSDQVLIYTHAEKCCRDVSYDMSVDTLMSDPRVVVRSVGSALGLCEEMLSQEWVNYVYNIYLDNLPEQDGRDLWHTDDQKQSVRTWAHGKVFNNPECKEWFDREGRFMSNQGTILAKKQQDTKVLEQEKVMQKKEKKEEKKEAFEEADLEEEAAEPFGSYP